MSKVVVANDHGAVELTARIIDFLKQKGFEVNYLGTSENKSVDYPDMAELACTEFLKGDYEFGVLCCGTGIGISISANKIHGIRCALPQNSAEASTIRRMSLRCWKPTPMHRSPRMRDMPDAGRR